ncbi:MAG: CrcB family protein [Acidimicrobiales bacterium]
MTVPLFVLAAALGALTRWQLTRLNDTDLHLGTVLVNVGAAFAAGLAVEASSTVALVFTTALLGSLSTFSTVMSELANHLTGGRRRQAISYLALSVTAGIAAASIGLELAN